MDIQNRPIQSITPYARNPRKNAAAVAKVRASIAEFGFRQPIVVDESGIIVAGHTRYQAALDLGLKTVPVHVATGLSKAQIKAYRIADNRTASEAEWDMELLALEIEELKEMDFDLDLTGFDEDELKGISLDGDGGDEPGLDETYSKKIEAPIYEPTGPCPKISELYDDVKYRELVEEIESSDIPKEIAGFLKMAATRHQVFNFRQIAEFYAHAPSAIQSLMEKSGLVIIDFNKAIEYGFVQLTERLGKIADTEGWNDSE